MTERIGGAWRAFSATLPRPRLMRLLVHLRRLYRRAGPAARSLSAAVVSARRDAATHLATRPGAAGVLIAAGALALSAVALHDLAGLASACNAGLEGCETVEAAATRAGGAVVLALMVWLLGTLALGWKLRRRLHARLEAIGAPVRAVMAGHTEIDLE